VNKTLKVLLSIAAVFIVTLLVVNFGQVEIKHALGGLSASEVLHDYIANPDADLTGMYGGQLWGTLNVRFACAQPIKFIYQPAPLTLDWLKPSAGKQKNDLKSTLTREEWRRAFPQDFLPFEISDASDIEGWDCTRRDSTINATLLHDKKTNVYLLYASGFGG
jgi:hypothetical protein